MAAPVTYTAKATQWLNDNPVKWKNKVVQWWQSEGVPPGKKIGVTDAAILSVAALSLIYTSYYMGGKIAATIATGAVAGTIQIAWKNRSLPTAKRETISSDIVELDRLLGAPGAYRRLLVLEKGEAMITSVMRVAGSELPQIAIQSYIDGRPLSTTVAKKLDACGEQWRVTLTTHNNGHSYNWEDSLKELLPQLRQHIATARANPR